MTTQAKTDRIGDAERRWLTDGRKNLGFMGALETSHLQDIIGCMTLASYAAGAKVCVEGDPGDAFFIIYDGGVEVTKKGWDEPVGRLIPGEFFGEMSLLFRKPRSATVTTTKPTRLFELKGADFSRMLEENPALADMVKAIADARLRELARS
jgi:CRP-like cAMP-binding protein